MIDEATPLRVHALMKELRQAICHVLPRTEVTASHGAFELSLRGEPLCFLRPLHSCVQLGLLRSPYAPVRASGPPHDVVRVRERKDIVQAVAKLLVTV